MHFGPVPDICCGLAEGPFHSKGAEILPEKTFYSAIRVTVLSVGANYVATDSPTSEVLISQVVPVKDWLSDRHHRDFAHAAIALRVAAAAAWLKIF